MHTHMSLQIDAVPGDNQEVGFIGLTVVRKWVPDRNPLHRALPVLPRFGMQGFVLRNNLQVHRRPSAFAENSLYRSLRYNSHEDTSNLRTDRLTTSSKFVNPSSPFSDPRALLARLLKTCISNLWNSRFQFFISLHAFEKEVNVERTRKRQERT